MLAPSITSLATCSSAASIPVNLEATQMMGIKKDIRDTTIPLGAAFCIKMDFVIIIYIITSLLFV